MAITGIASHIGSNGSAWLPATIALAIGARKNIWIRYIPNDMRDISAISFGVRFASMH